MTDEIELQMSDYLNEYPNSTSVERAWDQVKSKMLSLPLTKKRLQILGWIWGAYRENSDRKKTMESLGEFLTEKGIFKKEVVEPFDASKFRLITMDFTSRGLSSSDQTFSVILLAPWDGICFVFSNVDIKVVSTG